MDVAYQIIIGGLGTTVAIGLGVLTACAAKVCRQAGDPFSLTAVFIAGFIGSLTVFGATIYGILR